MAVIPTRILNPLPFGDLEPHRFEDLVRQLAYGFRRWKSLEATGRGGNDEGQDIRGIELVGGVAEEEGGASDVEEDLVQPVEERLWVFQCKREKAFSPKRVAQVIDEAVPEGTEAPYGFVLAVACDVSKAARDRFHSMLRTHGVQECHIWARGELEDMLFQAPNDPLLFAYFQISLQPRRRSARTALRSLIALKKQLGSLLDREDHKLNPFVLLRDPFDNRYPPRSSNHKARGRWFPVEALHIKDPAHLCVRRRRHLAWVNAGHTGWDALRDYDAALSSAFSILRGNDAWVERSEVDEGRVEQAFWEEYVPEEQKAWLDVYGFVPFDRILALDPLGDGFFPVPHILVEFEGKDGPYAPSFALSLVRTSGGAFNLDPTPDNRVRLFPKELPSATYPPLAAFEHQPPSEEIELGAESKVRMAQLLQSTAARRDRPNSGGAEEHLARMVERLSPFQAWKANVALPVFDAFVRVLRAKGQDARIVSRSEASGEYSSARETIELRFRVDARSVHNPTYRAPGYVRFSVDERLMEPAMGVSPGPPETRSYPPKPPTKVVELTREGLERIVLDVLERLSSGQL